MADEQLVSTLARKYRVDVEQLGAATSVTAVAAMYLRAERA